MGSEANDDEQLEIDDEKSEEQKKKSGKFDSSAADLEKVTDYVEEAEIQSQNISDVSLIYYRSNVWILQKVLLLKLLLFYLKFFVFGFN